MAYPRFHPRHPSLPPSTLTPAEFARAFPGEGHYVEFKQGLSENKVAEAVCAFSNADGGVILLGVGPNGQPAGLDVSGELKARVHRLVTRVHSPGRYDLAAFAVGEKALLAISVDRRREGFAQAPDGRVLQRREAQNVTLVGADLSKFLSDRALVRFESQPTATPLDQASSDLLGDVTGAWGWQIIDETPDRLVEKGLAAREGRQIVLTVAGSLYLLDDPATDQQKYHVEVFRYRDESTRYDRRLTINGPLHVQVRRATQTVLDELGTELVVVGAQRHDIPRVPTEAVREAIANAVAHRVYEDPRRAVRIDLRPGRVVIKSPGPLPEPVTIRNIREQNAPRNVAVIDTLRRFGLAEDAGRGIDVMEDVMDAHMLAPPEFADDGTSVTVTLSTTSTVSSEERVWLLGLERAETLSADERRLVLVAAREGSLTNASARSALGVDSVDARRILAGLCDRGFLTQHGTRGGASYVLTTGAAQPHAWPIPQAHVDAAILNLAQDGAITNEQVRRATGLDRASALRALNRLVDSGMLMRHGARRGATYELSPTKT